MLCFKNYKSAFTLFEVIISILISSIILVIISQILNNIFDFQVKVKEINILNNRLNSFFSIIERYIQNSYYNTFIIYKCKAKNNDCYKGNTQGYISAQEKKRNKKNYIVLSFLYSNPIFKLGKYSKDTQSFISYSGIIDLEDTTLLNNNFTIKDIYSNYDILKELLISYYKINDINTNNPFNDKYSVIMFSGPYGYGDISNIYDSYGYNNGIAKKLYKIDNYQTNNTTTKLEIQQITKDENTNHVYEKYKIINTAIAIVPKYISKNKTYELYLVDQYFPWRKNKNKYKDGKYTLILNNITKYQFKLKNKSILMKVCINSNFYKIKGKHFILCKEKYIKIKN